jgi:hypothetical protein
MRNVLLLILAFAVSAPGLHAQGTAWADKMFKEGNVHDFGSVPRGAQLYHRFAMTNIWSVPLQLTSIRVSCGCVTATPSSQLLQPRETGYLDITMDARRFTGPKAVSVYIMVGPQFISTATVRVSANSRADVVFNPGEINFGVVSSGQAPSQTIDVEYAGSLDWKVSDVIKNNAPVDVTLEEMYRRPGQVGYRLRTTLKPDAPSGLVKNELQLKTNDPASPLVSIYVEATVQAPLAITPATVNMGNVKVGDSIVKRFIVRADKPFKIVEIQGLGEGIEADFPQESAAKQVVILKYHPDQTGDMHRQLRIKTDLEKETSAAVTVEGNVGP